MTGSASYRPGDVVRRSSATRPPSCCRPPRRPGSRRIWALVDDGAGFDEVLDALIADGLRHCRASSWSASRRARPRSSSAVPPRAEFTTDDETVTVEGSAATTWAERSLRDVALDAHRRRRRRRPRTSRSATGLVRIARIDRPAAGSASPDRPRQPTTRHPPATRRPRRSRTATDETAYQPGFDPAPATPQAGRARRSGPPAARPAWTTCREVRRSPGSRTPPQPARCLPSPVARLTFSSGEVVDVDRAVVVGRAPEARTLHLDRAAAAGHRPEPTPGDLLDPRGDPSRHRAPTTARPSSPTWAPPTARSSSSPACRPRT